MRIHQFLLQDHCSAKAGKALKAAAQGVSAGAAEAVAKGSETVQDTVAKITANPNRKKKKRRQ